MEKCYLHWKRLESVDEKKDIVCRLEWMWLNWDVTSVSTGVYILYRMYILVIYSNKRTICVSIM